MFLVKSPHNKTILCSLSPTVSLSLSLSIPPPSGFGGSCQQSHHTQLFCRARPQLDRIRTVSGLPRRWFCLGAMHSARYPVALMPHRLCSHQPSRLLWSASVQNLALPLWAKQLFLGQAGHPPGSSALFHSFCQAVCDTVAPHPNRPPEAAPAETAPLQQ